MKIKSLIWLTVLLMSLSMIPASAYAASTPLPPKDFAADVLNDSSVKVTWTTPIDPTVVGYNIYRIDDLAGMDYVRVNGKMVTDSELVDKSISKGKSYSYMARSINTDGIESMPSNIAGAPKMNMKTSANVMHMGKSVRIATPGDVIHYTIDFANHGFGMAKNVVIVYAIPKGTTFISGTAKLPKYKANIAYFSDKSGKWADSVGSEEDISKVKFTVLEDLYPVSKDKMDTASLKVMVNY